MMTPSGELGMNYDALPAPGTAGQGPGQAAPGGLPDNVEDVYCRWWMGPGHDNRRKDADAIATTGLFNLYDPKRNWERAGCATGCGCDPGASGASTLGWG